MHTHIHTHTHTHTHTCMPFETFKAKGLDSKVQGYYIHKELFLGDEGQVCVSSSEIYVTHTYIHTHTCTHTHIQATIFIGALFGL